MFCVSSGRSLYLYSTPTVAGFFAGIEPTSPNNFFNSPIAFAGFKP